MEEQQRETCRPNVRCFPPKLNWLDHQQSEHHSEPKSEVHAAHAIKRPEVIAASRDQVELLRLVLVIAKVIPVATRTNVDGVPKQVLDEVVKWKNDADGSQREEAV